MSHRPPPTLNAERNVLRLRQSLICVSQGPNQVLLLLLGPVMSQFLPPLRHRIHILAERRGVRLGDDFVSKVPGPAQQEDLSGSLVRM